MVRTFRARTCTAALTAALLVAAGGLAACGSDDDSGSAGPSGGSSTAPTASVLGTPKPASGPEVLVGFVSTGKTATIDVSDEIKGAEAVVKYANAYLGGINGRPIKLFVCEEKSVPATAQDCANQFIAKKVLIVDNGSAGQAGLVFKGIDPAGIAMFGALNSDATILASANAFVVGNPLNGFGGSAAFARQEGNKKVTTLVIDVPSATGPSKALIPAFTKNAGSEGIVVPIAPGTADMSPQVQSAISNGTDQFHLIGDPAFCTSALKAIKNLAFKGDVTIIDRCVDEVGAASIPGGYEGTTILGQFNKSPASKEYQLFKAVMADGGVKETGASSSGYQGLLSLVRALNNAKVTDYTPAGFTAAIKSAPATDIPLGDGATFKCDGTALALGKAICSTYGVAGKAEKDGSVTTYGSLDTAGIYKLG